MQAGKWLIEKTTNQLARLLPYGKFLIDTKSEEYKVAERLEINLPEAFALKKSAVSTAVLISSSERNSGTVLRCRIDKGVLCIEKLPYWDEEGPLTIIAAAAFTVLGWHGQFTDTEYKEATFWSRHLGFQQSSSN